jgi:adenylylsulfate kinase
MMEDMDGERGVTVWLTGLPCSGKSSISQLVAAELKRRGRRVEVLDGDVVRRHLSGGLGFSREDRDTNVRRIGFVAHLLTRNGVIVLVAAISPYAAVRREVRDAIGTFVEVHVACPISECERRDVKGMYAKARAGELSSFTGVSDPYEAPVSPELALNTLDQALEQSARALLEYLERRGYVSATDNRRGPEVPFDAGQACCNQAIRDRTTSCGG